MRTPPIRPGIPYFAIVLGMFLLSTSLSAGPCLPVPPAQLLRFLPDAPKGWELKKSEAYHSFSDWLITNATREYTRVPAEGTPPPDAKSVPYVRLRCNGVSNGKASTLA